MAYIKRSDLERKARVVKIAAMEESVKRKVRDQSGTSVFLSHSHKDASIIMGALDYLSEQGVDVYVDWQDPEMPRTTNAATARRIRVKIKGNRKFILLATENALASRWVPWELGFADGVGKDKNMLIWPVQEGSRTWTGTEYVAIYPCIEEDRFGSLYVQYPADDGGQTETVRAWLAR